MSLLNQIRPYYKLQLYDLNANLMHTIEDEPITLKFKNCLTSNVGTFSFTLPVSADGFNFEYNDIQPYWFAKIQLAWPTELDKIVTFIGRIWQPHTTVSDQLGYRRVYKGRDYGALLQRNFKGHKEWIDANASDVVEDVADDLGLGKTKIESDSTDVTIIIDVDRHDSYFNIMKAVSDYWYSAGSQIKKDFYVDASADLVWKSRPIRTSGVESISISDMQAYGLLRDIQSVKNWIHIYGAPEKGVPYDKDAWTESVNPADGDWTSGGLGTVARDSTEEIVGTYCIKYVKSGSQEYYARLLFTLDAGKEANTNLYPSITFQIKTHSGPGDFSGYCTLQLLDDVPPNDNLVRREFTIDPWDKWTLIKFNCGKKHTDEWTHDVFNPGTFDWSNVRRFDITAHHDGTGDDDFYIDNLFFNSRNYYGFASSSASYNAYGYADLVVIDENLHSDSDCEKRAKALCYQKSGVPYRLDFQVSGNPNILIGDRIPITIDPDDLTAVDFDVISVEHVLSGEPVGWRTNVTALNTADLRTPPATNIPEYLIREKLENLLVSKGRLIVR